MDITLNPFEIKTIESSTPIQITMEDGSKYVAYQFKFGNKTTYQTRDEKTYIVEVIDDDSEI